MDTIDDHTLSGKMYDEEKYIKRFFLGFVCYLLAYLSSFIEFLPGNIINGLQLVGLIYFFYYSFKLISINNLENKYFKWLSFLFLGWEFFILVRNYSLDYDHLKAYLFEPYQFLHYFIPVIILFPTTKSQSFINLLFKIFHRLGGLFILLLPIYFIFYGQNLAEQYVWILGTGCGFIILTFSYHSKKMVIYSYAVTTIALILMVIMARRNIIFTFFNYLFFSLLLFFFASQRTIKQKNLAFVISILVILLSYQVFVTDSFGVFSKIKGRASDDSREVVVLSMFADMSEMDLIIGKGLDGSYYCPGVDEDFIGREITYRDADYRDTIENGFLQMILKGGVVFPLLFLLIAIPAIIKGYCFSNNILSKASASIVLLWILDMIPFGLPIFSIRYLLLWICIAICYSKSLREMNDDHIAKMINLNSENQ